MLIQSDSFASCITEIDKAMACHLPSDILNMWSLDHRWLWNVLKGTATDCKRAPKHLTTASTAAVLSGPDQTGRHCKDERLYLILPPSIAAKKLKNGA